MLENTAAECRTLSYTLTATNFNQTHARVSFSLENLVEKISQTVPQSIICHHREYRNAHLASSSTQGQEAVIVLISYGLYLVLLVT